MVGSAGGGWAGDGEADGGGVLRRGVGACVCGCASFGEGAEGVLGEMRVRRGGEAGQAVGEGAEAAEVALRGFDGDALWAFDRRPGALGRVGGVGRGHGDEHVPEVFFHGEDAVGCAGHPARGAVVGGVGGVVVVVALDAAFQGGLVFEEVGDVVHADAEERSEALDRGRGFDYVADGQGYV